MRAIIAVILGVLIFLAGCSTKAETDQGMYLGKAPAPAIKEGTCDSECKDACIIGLKEFGYDCYTAAKTACSQKLPMCLDLCSGIIDEDSCEIYCRTGLTSTCRKNMEWACLGMMQDESPYQICMISCKAAKC